MSTTKTPVDEALQLLRPKWSIELIYQNLLGYKRFGDLQQRTGIAKNLLSQRLGYLAANGIFKKVPVSSASRRHEYRLTEKGLALLPVMITLHQWSERWLANESNSGSLIDTGSDSEIATLVPRNTADEPVNLHQIKLVFNRE